MYGREDPAYGPPDPEWYTRNQTDSQTDQPEQRPSDELQHARGPFEPLPRPAGSGREPVSYQPVGYESPGADGDGRDHGGTQALDQIRNLYATAAAAGPEDLDRHFQGLLERQRELISEYFSETVLQEDPR